MSIESIFRKCVSDARHFQMGCQAILLVYGTFFLGFQVTWQLAAAFIGTTLAAQYALTKVYRLPAFDFRSPLITGFALCLMLRTQTIPIAIFCAVLAIGSKFLIRWRGKHIFNPANFAIVFALLFIDSAWVPSGQWGSGAWLAVLITCLGGTVVFRATRADTAIAVLVFWAAILVRRALYLGDPMTIPLHQMQNGGILVFAFFMITDPKATPNSRIARIVFVFLVCLGASYVQFRLFQPNGLLYALAFCSPLVPLFDRLFPGNRYQWNSSTAQPKGVSHETDHGPTEPSGLPVPQPAR